MTTRRTKTKWLLASAAAVALAAAGLQATSAMASQSNASTTNPGQADGEGIITIEQVNMCMWGSEMTPGCFPNDEKPDSDAWKKKEAAVAKKKRDSVITQYDRHIPDVLTVSEGCLNDLEYVAEEIGYDLKYEDTGDGTDYKPRQCSVDRGPAVNAILAKKFTGDGPKGYYEDPGYRSYVCAEVSTDEWEAVTACTTHLSLASQGDSQDIECEMLRDEILGKIDGYVLLAGDLNKKGKDNHCMPSGYHGMTNTERNDEDSTVLSGLEHIYYTANGFWRQSCGWSYTVEDTDHKGFLLELGTSKPDGRGDCWRSL